MTHNHTTSQPDSTIDTPRIYVACLAAYNNGKLHGVWIDATLDPDAIMEAVQTMLAASPEADAEEWAIHDYDGFHGIQLSEWEGFTEVHAYATFIEEHGQLGAAVLTYNDNDLDEAESMLEDSYAGCYESLADYAQELTEDTTQIPENLAYYIDYERMARDMEMSGDIFTITTAYNEVHVFWHH